ncbi:BCD family MFS transporter [Nonomuraea sp. PA05]|nr:BCD family MFS transporter [Nonomuraea sp. PA05]
MAAHYHSAMFSDLVFSAIMALLIAGFVGLPLSIAAATIPAARLSAPSDRHEPMSRKAVVLGLFASFAGVWLMGLGAWLASGDSRYGALESLGVLLITLVGAGVLAAGLGPLPSWLLETLGPVAERLPSPFRLAVRDLTQRRARAVVAITLVMLTSGFGLALTIIAVGETTQSRAEYLPQGRPGSLLVQSRYVYLEPFSAVDAATIRAAIERELPGVPIVQNETVPDSSRFFNAAAENIEMPEEAVYGHHVIGDEKLLRYLTGDQSTPYDESTAVVVTSAGVQVDSVNLFYELHKDDETTQTKTVRAAVAKPADPYMQTIFVPAELVRDLGFQLQPAELIVDPTLHRVTAEEQQRLDDLLDDALADIYVERGFQASTGWLLFAAAAFLAAVGCSLSSGFGVAANARQARVMRRAGNGSAAAFRWFCASRAGLSALCGTVLGAVAGGPAGMLLLWPLTVRSAWEDPARVPFETPWPAVVVIVTGLPVLAAALGAIFAREHPHVSAPAASRPDTGIAPSSTLG